MPHVELHQDPHRHYKIDGKWTANKQRVASVTAVLGGSDGLTNWAANQAAIAGETAARRYLGAGDDLDHSILPWRALVELTGEMPDHVRDAAAARGTAAHHYLAEALEASSGLYGPADGAHVEYGHREAIDAFIDHTGAGAFMDDHGLRVERAVGCPKLAVAGTYDAQVVMDVSGGDCAALHRIDLKSGSSVQPTALAQLAMYERLAVRCGESPSEYLTIVHIDSCGGFKLHTVPVGGRAYNEAIELFHSYLNIYRSAPRLAKLLKEDRT